MNAGDRMSGRSLGLIVALGVVLLLPSLRSGFLLDDYYYQQAAQGILDSRPADQNLHTIYPGDEALTRRWAELGYAPWWVDEGLRISFFRPLTEKLCRLDIALFDRSAAGYHAHSLLWWAGCLLAGCLLLRRVLRWPASLLACLILAVDKSHMFPAIWIANRHALVALAPLLFGLWAHVRWREDGWRPGRLLAVAGAGLGLLGGEVAVAGLAYFAAYELLGAPAGPLRRRLGLLAPFVILGLAYVAAHRLLGHGTAGAEIYVDPGREPLRFLVSLARSVPILLASGIGGLSAELGYVDPAFGPLLVGTGLVAGAGLAVLLRWCWPHLDGDTRRAVRWLLGGALLALVPSSTVNPGDRMVLAAALGFSGVLGVVLDQAWRAWRRRTALPSVRRRLLVAAGGALALAHLVMPAATGQYLQRLIDEQCRISVDLVHTPVVRSARDRQAVVINPPDHVVGLYLPLIIGHEYGFADGAAWRVLSLVPHDLVLRRPQTRTLELETAGDGVFLRSAFEGIYRDRRHPLPVGTRLARGLFAVEIVAAADGWPTRVAFHFDRDLEDPSLAFLVWRDGELLPADLPEVGGELYLKRTLGPAGF